MYDFSREVILAILGNMCIVIICCSVCEVINLEINRSPLIKPFFYITKKSRQKYKYIKNEKSFYHEIKSIFHHFQRDFIEVNRNKFLKGESPTLSYGKTQNSHVKFGKRRLEDQDSCKKPYKSTCSFSVILFYFICGFRLYQY